MFYRPMVSGGVSGDDCVAILQSNIVFPKNTWTKVTATQVLKDPNSNYNVSTKRYVVPANGEYFVIVHLGVNYVDNDIQVKCRLYVNGVGYGDEGLSVGIFGNEPSKLVNQAYKLTLTAGDYLEAYGQHNNAADRSMDVSKYKHGITIVRLS